MIAKLTKYIKDTLDAAILASTSTDLLYPIKTVYNWSPRAFNEANLPAIVVEAIDSSYQKMLWYYKGVYRIKITVKYPSKLKYWSIEYDIVQIKKTVQDILEWYDDSICGLDAKSIAWILSKKMCIVVDGCTIANDLYLESVTYEEVKDGSVVWYQWGLTIVLFNSQLKY